MDKIEQLSIFSDIKSRTVSKGNNRSKKYQVNTNEFVYSFNSQIEPISVVNPGDLIEANTQDASSGKIRNLEDYPSKVAKTPYVNPLTGPIKVVDAEPGDSLLVFTLSITPTEKRGFSWFKSDFGALVSSTTTPTLNPPLIEKVWSYEIENNNVTIRFNNNGREVTLEYKPFLGSIGCAPLEEAPHSLVPHRHGGNMDAIENGIGSCLILPVLVPGAYLYFGDAHAVQGDGELCGVAVEIPTNVVLRIDLIKGKQVSWPMIENDEFIMAVGSARPLEDAYRIACKEIVLWLHKEKGFELRDAYQLASQTIKCRIGNVVDPFYTIVAKFPKSIL